MLTSNRHNNFQIDDRILSTSIFIKELTLSTLLFKNDMNYSWFVLVPRKPNINEIFELDIEERKTLIEEINSISIFIKNYFNVDKINVGSLGNIVSQLHIHIVGRNFSDPLWPQSIWHEGYISKPYQKNQLEELVLKFKNSLIK